MVKYRIAVAILMLSISSNLVACKSDNSKQESIVLMKGFDAIAKLFFQPNLLNY